MLEALTSDARTRIAYVRDGLRSILQMLSHAPGTVVVVDVTAEPTGGGQTLGLVGAGGGADDAAAQGQDAEAGGARPGRWPRRGGRGQPPKRRLRHGRAKGFAKPATMKARGARPRGKSKRRASAARLSGGR